MSRRQWCIAIIILAVLCIIGAAVSVDLIGHTATATVIAFLSVISIIVSSVLSFFIGD